MPDRNGYIPGVPCWVDTMHADPSTATEFYEGLFGWETENALPPGSPGEYHLARIRGRVVAGIGSQPGVRSPRRDVEHLHLGRQRRRGRGASAGGRRSGSR